MQEVTKTVLYIIKAYQQINNMLIQPSIKINELRQRINAYFIDISRDSNGKSLIYPLCAFFDEMITEVLSDKWSQYPLQMEHFNEYTAGEGFFLKIDQLIRHPTGHITELNVYYLCLSLGFKGKYLSSENYELKKITNKLRELLINNLPLENISVNIKCSSASTAVRHKWFSYAYLIYGFFGCAIFFWLMFKIIVWYQASHIINRLNIMAMINS